MLTESRLYLRYFPYAACDMYFWRIFFPRVFPMTVPSRGGGEIFLQGGECGRLIGKCLMRISVLGEYGNDINLSLLIGKFLTKTKKWDPKSTTLRAQDRKVKNTVLRYFLLGALLYIKWVLLIQYFEELIEQNSWIFPLKAQLASDNKQADSCM